MKNVRNVTWKATITHGCGKTKPSSQATNYLSPNPGPWKVLTHLVTYIIQKSSLVFKNFKSLVTKIIIFSLLAITLCTSCLWHPMGIWVESTSNHRMDFQVTTYTALNIMKQWERDLEVGEETFGKTFSIHKKIGITSWFTSSSVIEYIGHHYRDIIVSKHKVRIVICVHVELLTR